MTVLEVCQELQKLGFADFIGNFNQPQATGTKLSKLCESA